MKHNAEQTNTIAKKQQTIPTVSAVLQNGALLELVYDPHERRTSFVAWKEGAWTVVPNYPLDSGERLVPYSPNNNLIKNEVILFPSTPEEYGSEEELVRDIQTYIHRYVDVSPQFERIASYYVLFSWLYDGFNEVPYMRLRGDYGTGKTRFLLTVGSLCYKPAFASGASTVSPIFRILDAFRGTLIIDEADFRYSDEKADIVKILNNGNVNGMPVLRAEVSAQREFNPQAFQVFGPKIVATRGYYDDPALESRFITEEMGGHGLRPDIPITLPSEYKDEARQIRNKLLLFRFRNFGKKRADDTLADPTIEPRLNQIFVPLMSVISDSTVRKEVIDVARQYNREMIVERGMDVEAQVLEVIRDVAAESTKGSLTIKEITAAFSERYGEEYEAPVTNKWIGTIIRRKLKLKTQKSHGVYVIPLAERPKLKHLYQKYAIAESDETDTNGVIEAVDRGYEGDVERGVEE